MSAGFHALVHDADDLDETGCDGAIEDHVNRITDRRFSAFVSAVPDVKATNAIEHFAAVHSRGATGIGCDPLDRRRDQRSVAIARLDAMHCLARPQQSGDIGLSRSRKPIAPHLGSSRRWCGEAVKVGVEVLVLNFVIFPAIERFDPGFDALPQPFEL